MLLSDKSAKSWHFDIIYLANFIRNICHADSWSYVTTFVSASWELVKMKDFSIFIGCTSIWAVSFLHIVESQFGNVKPKKYLYIIFFSAAIVSRLASTMSAASECEVFEESKLCISQLTNLIYRQPTEDEVVCQELCQSHTKCSHFTFVENKYPLETGEPRLQCYMWKRCISKVTLILYPNMAI